MVASAREKEVLLREMHHRVKNNLAMINSLLGFQAEYAAEEAHRKVFQDCQSRLRSMAVAHELLYQSDALADLRADEYVARLVDHLAIATGGTRIPISVIKEIAPVSLELNKAIPLGFVLTELVSNCFKYAFAGGETGEIIISFQPVGENELELIVRDNGVGLPEAIDPANPQSLGLELVDTFVEQLGGVIEILRKGGTEVRIRFAHET